METGSPSGNATTTIVKGPEEPGPDAIITAAVPAQRARCPAPAAYWPGRSPCAASRPRSRSWPRPCLVQKLKILVAHDELTNLILHLLEGRRWGVALIFDLDDVEAEIGLHRRLGISALLKREGCVFEFLDHAAAREITEIAAFRLVRIGGLFLGEFGEILAGVELLDDVLGFVLGLDEDMTGVDFFLLRQGGDFLVVAGLDFVRRYDVDDMLLK